jgi:hypothetical protein
MVGSYRRRMLSMYSRRQRFRNGIHGTLSGTIGTVTGSGLGSEWSGQVSGVPDSGYNTRMSDS